MPPSFWQKVFRTSSCWLWTAAHSAKGYGYTSVKLPTGKHKTVYAHRLVWEAHHGPIGPGLQVCHRCDNPSCVRLSHLFIGTAQDNATDKCSKGRQAKGASHGRVLNPSAWGVKKRTLLPVQVHCIRSLRRAGVSVANICAATEYNHTSVRLVLAGKTYKGV